MRCGRDQPPSSANDESRGSAQTPPSVQAALDDCPVCFAPATDDAKFCRAGNCGHVFCQRCIERVVTTTKLDNPTRAPCPICRSELSLFDLRVVSTGELLHPKDTDLSPLAGCVMTQDRTPGLASYHFPDDVSEPGPEPGLAVLPYLSYESRRVDGLEGWRLDDGSRPPPRKPFENGHWHAPTRTFHATVSWPEGWYGSHRWDYVMQFSTDLRYIRGGSVTMHRDGCVHPMDGKWQVVWVPPLPDLPNGASIDVVAGEWTLLGVPCRLDLSDRSSPHFPWPTGRDGNQVRATQRLASVVNPDGATLGPAAGLSFDNGRGPPVGSSVVWSTDDRAQPSMTWVRESIGAPPPPRVTPFGPRGLYYLRQIDRAPLSPPLYRAGAVWGNTFVQGLKVGLASYHFIAEDGEGEGGAYISYEHPHCALWPPLDDGAPVPARAPFTEVEWDAPARTFRGVIAWQETYGTTWEGCARWRYEMVFDADFTCILSGRVHSTVDGHESEMSTFGEQLVYVNAASEQFFTSVLERGNARGPEDARQPEPQGEAEQQAGTLQLAPRADAPGEEGLAEMSARLGEQLQAAGASMQAVMILQALLASAQAAMLTRTPELDEALSAVNAAALSLVDEGNAGAREEGAPAATGLAAEVDWEPLDQLAQLEHGVDDG